MLTQDEYKLYTGEISNLSDEDWSKIVSLSAVRLAGLLCLEELPTNADGDLPSDLAMLLANFICIMLAHRGRDEAVSSKRVRNFTINYGNNATNAFAKLQENYMDIIEKYSNCGTGVYVERNARHYCGCF